MNPNPQPLTEYELISLELAARNARTVEILTDRGCVHLIAAVTADYYTQLADLKAFYEQEARRAPSESAEAWPTVDRIDLHLPETPAPAGKVFAGIDGDEAIWFQGDGYYCLNRKTGTTRALTNPVEIDIMRQCMETIGRQS